MSRQPTQVAVSANALRPAFALLVITLAVVALPGCEEARQIPTGDVAAHEMSTQCETPEHRTALAPARSEHRGEMQVAIFRIAPADYRVAPAGSTAITHAATATHVDSARLRRAAYQVENPAVTQLAQHCRQF